MNHAVKIVERLMMRARFILVRGDRSAWVRSAIYEKRARAVSILADIRLVSWREDERGRQQGSVKLQRGGEKA